MLHSGSTGDGPRSPARSWLVPRVLAVVVGVGVFQVAKCVLHRATADMVWNPQRCRGVLLAVLTHDGLLEDGIVRFHLVLSSGEFIVVVTSVDFLVAVVHLEQHFCFKTRYRAKRFGFLFVKTRFHFDDCVAPKTAGADFIRHGLLLLLKGYLLLLYT